MTWPRPVPLVGDTTSAAARAAAPMAWAFPEPVRDALRAVIGARRDIRRFRPDPVPESTLTRLLEAAHAAPSVGHSQPWRFIVVRDAETRDRAAVMSDRERLAQAAQLEPEASRHLLDLQLEGIREAPLGIVVCCDRRAPAAGVLGRATFHDADLWSCACAIQNLWLAARAEGLGVGWVTLFRPDELGNLLHLPEGVVTLGWLCVGWPDERPPAPGLERAGWSRRAPLADVVMQDRWPDQTSPAPPSSRLRAPAPEAVVGARDAGDVLLTPPWSLGVLDRAVDRVLSLGHDRLDEGTLVLAVGRHPVAALGTSAFAPSVTEDVLDAAQQGRALGAVAAAAAGLELIVTDVGTATGNLRDEDPLSPSAVRALSERGTRDGRSLGGRRLLAAGEMGVGNTTVAAALTCALLGVEPAVSVGLGSGSDSAILATKQAVVESALARWRAAGAPRSAGELLRRLGGPEFAYLHGLLLGAAEAGAVVVLDGLATGVAALLAVREQPAVSAHLVAGQRSRERAHALVLQELGLEPLLDLRLRAGEGVGAALGVQLLRTGLTLRTATARTSCDQS